MTAFSLARVFDAPPGARIAALVVLALLGCGEQKAPAPAAKPGTPARSAGGCRVVDAPDPKPEGRRTRPPRRLDAKDDYSATVSTNCGDFTMELDVAAAPRAAASFVALANDGFFEDTVFHRVVPGFVIQGGDPTGSGMAGPGYKTVDRPPRDAEYTKGVVAMAKGGDEPPGTAGSQFFVVTAPDAGLPPQYAVLGRVTMGLDVVDRIGRLGDPASGQAGTPVEPVVIDKIEIAGP